MKQRALKIGRREGYGGPQMSSAPVQEKIQGLVQDHPVMVFMKGHRFAPQCGFSARVVEILDGYLEDYQTCDVLADEEVREGVKAFASWPTIPQIYLNGEFMGGCEILEEMHKSGELKRSLGDLAVEFPPPKIKVLDSAVSAIRAAVEQPEGEVLLRLRVDGRFYNDLSVEEERPGGDLEVLSNGITVLVDPASARRCEGVKISFVQDGAETGFRIDNPNAPETIRQISVQELAALLKQRPEGMRLVDVRREDEWERCSIEGSELYSNDLAVELHALPRTTALVFLCHHGHRSQKVAESYVAKGFSDVINVMGGIDAWAAQVDPSMNRY